MTARRRRGVRLLAAACILLSTTLALTQSSQGANGVTLVAPTNVQAGQPAVVSWSAPAEATVFLSGFGIVGTKGSVTIKPTSTTDFTLIVESKSGLASTTARTVVSGGRSIEYPFDLERFKNPVTYTVPGSSIARFVAFAWRVLQDDLRYSIPGALQRGSEVTLITNLSEKPTLVSANEPSIGARRVALKMSAASQDPQHINLTLSAIVEYRRRVEPIFRPESNEQLYRRVLEDLRDRLVVFKD